MVAPRFVNPHSLPDDGVVVTRARLFGNEDIEEIDATDDSGHLEASLIRKLDDFLCSHFESTYEVGELPTEKQRRKRRKVESKEEPVKDVAEPETIPFRLMSGADEHAISLLLKPPPELNIRVREPPPEDTEIEAQEREMRARSIAVDASFILTNSRLVAPSHTTPRRIVHVTLKKPCLVDDPPLMLLNLSQSFRATRPPVPSTELAYWPYSKGKPASESHQRLLPTLECTASNVAQDKRRRRRRRALKHRKERTQPRFWEPDPRWRGKCMGYAMGY